MNVSADEFHLSCEGTLLDSADKLTSLTCCELDITVPLLGGKVHGSLARAGTLKKIVFIVEQASKTFFSF